MQEDDVIQINHVAKEFVLPYERNSSIKSYLINVFKEKNKVANVNHTLKDVSFTVKKGEFFGILGRNGSGKSTLLKILAEIYQPTSGNVQVKGKLVPFIELGVGFNPELTGRENVYLNGALLGFSNKEIDEKYDDIVAFAELEEYMDQKLKNYSSGMQVRLAFSVATRANADILLIDEVLAVGDADFQRKCFSYFKYLKKQKKTIIFVSHDMGAVNEYCDRAILIENGKVASSGGANNVSQQYLKLFNVQKQEQRKRQDGKRWGNEWVVFESISIKISAKELTIKANALAKRDVNDVVYGVRIRNESDKDIAGTNSAILGQNHLSIKRGDRKNIQWKMANMFSNGKYVVDPAITIGDGATVCDWWNDAARFTVEKEKSTAYIITPDIDIKISDERS